VLKTGLPGNVFRGRGKSRTNSRVQSTTYHGGGVPGSYIEKEAVRGTIMIKKKKGDQGKKKEKNREVKRGGKPREDCKLPTTKSANSFPRRVLAGGAKG